MGDQTPTGYPSDDPETAYPPEAGVDTPEEIPANDFDNPFAGSPESAEAYRAGYREGAFGNHSPQPPPEIEESGLADVWLQGNEAGLRRFAAYGRGFRAGIEGAFSGETAVLPAGWTGELEAAWRNGRDAGVQRAEEIHEEIRHKAVTSTGFDHASGPVHEYVTDSGRWYAQEYGDGQQAIFLHSSGATYALDAWIYPEYRRLGVMKRPMGAPMSDTTAVGDGKGWCATFQGGEIYATAEFGAHEVRGKIREFWQSLGPPNDMRSLGYPTSGRKDDLIDGGWAQTFERGDIFQWAGANTPIQLREVEIHYRGMNCFGDTSEPGADEPYPIITVLGPPVHHPDGSETTEKSFTLLGPEESAVGGGSYPRDQPVYRGRASDVAAIAVTLMEHDTGDPEAYRSQVEEGVRAAVAGAAVVMAATGVGLPVSALVLWLGQAGAGPISHAVTTLFDTKDDRIGHRIFPLTPQRLFDMAGSARLRERDVEFHFGGEGDPISGDDGSYKVYFDVRFV